MQYGSPGQPHPASRPPAGLTLPLYAEVPDAATCRLRLGMLQPLLDGLFEAACVIDGSSLTVLGHNEPVSRQLGLTGQGLVGQPVSALAISPEDHHFWLNVQDTLRAGLSATDTRLQLHSDSYVQRADGHLLAVERRIAPIELPSGHPAWLLTWKDDSARRRAEAETDRLANELLSSLEGSRDAVLVTDLGGAVRGCNRAFLRLLGLPPETSANEASLAERIRQLAADHAACESCWQQLMSDARRSRTDMLPLADGRTLEWHSVPQYAQGEPVGRIHAWRDMTQQLADEARLRLAAEVFDTMNDALLVLDAAHRVVAANQACARLWGRPATELLGQLLSQLLLSPTDPDALTLALTSLSEQDRWDGELQLADNATPVQTTLVTVAGNQQSASRYVVALHDLREKRAQQQTLLELSHRDPLTHLPNRQRLGERVELAIEQATRSHIGFAMLSIGLDRFTQINDSLGHDVGDAVLIETARRLCGCVRDEDMVARLGGDTFVVLLHQADAAVAEAIARRVLASLNRELVVGGEGLSTHASIGAAFYPADGASMDDLVKNADIAMHHAKRGGGALRFYERRMNSELLAKVRLDHAMREALREQRFVLHYQPKVDLPQGNLIGCEALLRWSDPVLGNVPPGEFIPVAEETGFIVELGDYVLNMAIERAALWHASGAKVPVAVNIAALQFQQANFVERVQRLLSTHGLPPQLLELEITEGALVADIHELIARLQTLANHGVQLSIDDFGTGYSSLSFVKRLPIHRLKIDRSFVKDLPDDASDAAIVRSVIELGRARNLHVVAEGVETEAQRDFLIQAGCDEAQGFLYAKPLPVAQFERRYGLRRGMHPVAARRKRA